MIRAVYRFRVHPGKEEDFLRSWRQIVSAHGQHGALESMMLKAPEEGEYMVVSRWESLEAWESGRTDDAHPEAYTIFRASMEVVSREVFDEIELISS